MLMIAIGVGAETDGPKQTYGNLYIGNEILHLYDQGVNIVFDTTNIIQIKKDIESLEAKVENAKKTKQIDDQSIDNTRFRIIITSIDTLIKDLQSIKEQNTPLFQKETCTLNLGNLMSIYRQMLQAYDAALINRKKRGATDNHELNRERQCDKEDEIISKHIVTELNKIDESKVDSGIKNRQYNEILNSYHYMDICQLRQTIKLLSNENHENVHVHSDLVAIITDITVRNFKISSYRPNLRSNSFIYFRDIIDIIQGSQILRKKRIETQRQTIQEQVQQTVGPMETDEQITYEEKYNILSSMEGSGEKDIVTLGGSDTLDGSGDDYHLDHNNVNIIDEYDDIDRLIMGDNYDLSQKRKPDSNILGHKKQRINDHNSILVPIPKSLAKGYSIHMIPVQLVRTKHVTSTITEKTSIIERVTHPIMITKTEIEKTTLTVTQTETEHITETNTVTLNIPIQIPITHTIYETETIISVRDHTYLDSSMEIQGDTEITQTTPLTYTNDEIQENERLYQELKQRILSINELQTPDTNPQKLDDDNRPDTNDDIEYINELNKQLFTTLDKQNTKNKDDMEVDETQNENEMTHYYPDYQYFNTELFTREKRTGGTSDQTNDKTIDSITNKLENIEDKEGHMRSLGNTLTSFHNILHDISVFLSDPNTNQYKYYCNTEFNIVKRQGSTFTAFKTTYLGVELITIPFCGTYECYRLLNTHVLYHIGVRGYCKAIKEISGMKYCDEISRQIPQCYISLPSSLCSFSSEIDPKPIILNRNSAIILPRKNVLIQNGNKKQIKVAQFTLGKNPDITYGDEEGEKIYGLSVKDIDSNFKPNTYLNQVRLLIKYNLYAIIGIGVFSTLCFLYPFCLCIRNIFKSYRYRVVNQNDTNIEMEHRRERRERRGR